MKFRKSTFKWAFYCLLSGSFSLPTHAAIPTPEVLAEQLIIKNQGTLFQQNLGQLLDPAGNALPGIRYYSSQGNMHVYCESTRLSFVFTKVIRNKTATPSNPGLASNDPIPESISIEASRMEMEIIGANPSAIIIAEEKQDQTTNYFLKHTGLNGITGINSYKKLIYKDIYPNIDMLLKSSGKGIEYSFLVHPGGNVNDIKLRWNGANKTEALPNGNISYSNTLGTLQESAPISIADGKSVISNRTLKGDSHGFNVESYDNSRELVIDPILSWATFYGGSASDEGRGICTDISGNIYISGNTLSTSGIATTGAFLTTLSGTNDAFVSKFSSTGVQLWATYYGGTSANYKNGVSTDASGNVYIAGNTNSATGIATSGAYQTSFGGFTDGFLAKFSSTGTRLWATYFGGSGSDIAVSVNTDANGNAYVTGQTGSSAGIATSGAYLSSLSGNLDAFLAKFSSTGSLTWATYYGGTASTAGNSVRTDASGNVYLTGGTSSTTSIATSGAHQTSFAGGGHDAFVAKFSSAGNLLWGSYFGGTADDIASGINIDASGQVCITGITGSSSGIATTGAYQTSFAGATGFSDCFLATFSSSGSINWATYYGGSGYDAANGITTDVSGNIYITGQTSSSGMATSGAFQTASGGGSQDAFLAKFSNAGILSKATYYGGTGSDVGYGIVTDASGNVFITGFTTSTALIATPGSFQTSNAGGGEAFLAKFNSLGTGISPEQNTEFLGLNIYPNPFSTTTNIQMAFAIAQQVSIEIWSLQGKLVQTVFSGNVASSIPYNFMVDGSNMSPGMYMVRVLYGDHSVYKRINLVK